MKNSGVRPATRRVWYFWLLLLLPALAAGVVAIQLLRREQSRITQQGVDVLEARRAAATARARLIAENVELFVGDVQDGLLETLAEQPLVDLNRFMDTWENENPLVRIGYIAREEGGLLRPSDAETDDRARGFVRRYRTAFSGHPPWQLEKPSIAEERDVNLKDEAESHSRREVASNVAQVQSARRDVQELLKARSYQSGSVAESKSPNSRSVAKVALPAGVSVGKQEMDAAPAAPTESSLALSAPPQANVNRRGWTAVPLDGRLHLMGWIQIEGEDQVRGVELDLAALVARLGRALPAETSAGEGFVLRDAQGRSVHQVGVVTRSELEPAARVPLSNAMLAGWTVTGYLPLSLYSGEGGSGFFLIGSVLVSIFIVAILAGGWLLLSQARRSDADAAQKTSFVANVSHEFKTPLTTIRLYSELLEQGRIRDAKQGADYLRTIGRETERLARLVNNALDFSQLEQGQRKFSFRSVELASELGQFLDTHLPRMTDAGLTLVRALPPVPLTVTTDPDALEQILLNLTENACKYAGSGGEVCVSAKPIPLGGAEIRVADRGPGVPSEQQEQIFEKFYRVNDALTAEKSGAGLGLSIARQLAIGLNGGLRYEPRPGGGAVFILQLP